jgi:hypothetical protein
VLLQFQDGTEIHQDVMNLAHLLLLDVTNLAHLLLLDVLQNLAALHQDVNLSYLDAVHLVLVALLDVMVVALVDVALVDVASHQLRMDYYLRAVDVADYLQRGLVPVLLVFHQLPLVHQMLVQLELLGVQELALLDLLEFQVDDVSPHRVERSPHQSLPVMAQLLLPSSPVPSWQPLASQVQPQLASYQGTSPSTCGPQGPQPLMMLNEQTRQLLVTSREVLCSLNRALLLIRKRGLLPQLPSQ